MADKERRLKWMLWADAKKFKEGLNDANKSLSGFQKKSQSMFSGIQKAAIAAFSVTAIANYMRVATEAANVQQQAEAKLTTALKGRVDVMREIGSVASELQKKTLFGDEVTIEAAAQLAAFVKNEEQIKRLLPAIQDMATAMRMDLVSAAALVGKTIGASTNALARYGISVEGAAGSAERAESAIAALTSKFEGQSAAAAKTGTGAVTQLKNAIGDLNEQVGAFIITFQNFLATNRFVKGLLDNTAKTLTIMSVKWTAWEKLIIKFEGQSKTYQRALKKIEEEQQKVMRGFYDMSQDSISQDDPLMVSMRNLLSAVQDLSNFAGEHSEQLKAPAPEVPTKYEELSNKFAELTKQAQALAAENKDTSDITARIAAIDLQIASIDELIEKQKESATWNLKYGGTYSPASSITGQGASVTGSAGLDTKTLGDMSGMIAENTAEVESYFAQIQASGERVADMIRFAFEDMARGAAEAFGNLAAGSGSMAQVAQALMNPIANLAIELGVILLGVGKGIEALKASLATISGPIATIAGIALIALGTAAKAGVAKLGSGGGGYSGASTGTYDLRSAGNTPQLKGLNASAIKVEVVGETVIRNKDIFIAYKNAESFRKMKT